MRIEMMMHCCQNPKMSCLMGKVMKKKRDRDVSGIMQLMVAQNYELKIPQLDIDQYQLTEILPKKYRSALPSIEEIEAEFGGMDG